MGRSIANPREETRNTHLTLLLDCYGGISPAAERRSSTEAIDITVIHDATAGPIPILLGAKIGPSFEGNYIVLVTKPLNSGPIRISYYILKSDGSPNTTYRAQGRKLLRRQSRRFPRSTQNRQDFGLVVAFQRNLRFERLDLTPLLSRGYEFCHGHYISECQQRHGPTRTAVSREVGVELGSFECGRGGHRGVGCGIVSESSLPADWTRKGLERPPRMPRWNPVGGGRARLASRLQALRGPKTADPRRSTACMDGPGRTGVAPGHAGSGAPLVPSVQPTEREARARSGLPRSARRAPLRPRPRPCRSAAGRSASGRPGPAPCAASVPPCRSRGRCTVPRTPSGSGRDDGRSSGDRCRTGRA